jgi:hypothetical protein
MLRVLPTDARDHGASAIFIAFTMVVVLGMAALVIDATGAGFNERRQDQTAADTAVMAGAMGYVLGESDQEKVTNVLSVARENLDTEYSDAEWQALWEACEDPDIDAVDVGTGTPEQFFPMVNPFASPGTPTLECVSESSSYIRVVIPRQAVETTFGKVIGFDSVETYALAIARIESDEDADGIIPFGIPGGSGSGEACLSTNPSGPAEPPCQGPDGGGFGPINSEFFGDYFGSPSCANPGSTELAQNVALGIDHFIDVWPEDSAIAAGVSIGDPHPGDATVGGYPDVSYDQCSINSGVVEPQQAGHEFPPNTMRVDTGFSQSSAVEEGLISDTTFLGEPSRLQNTDNSTQILVKRDQGSNTIEYELDDRGPWTYLTGSGACSSTAYDTLLTTEERVALFQTCLTGYTGTTDIFDPGIGDSPRFAWAPQYWHDVSTTGTSWQPVQQYRIVFIGGLWFNCNASSVGDCGAVYYPDEDSQDNNDPICDEQGSNCQLLNLDQMSAWVLPDEAVPDSVKASFPSGEVSPFLPTLYR